MNNVWLATRFRDAIAKQGYKVFGMAAFSGCTVDDEYAHSEME
jgi:hypothetical protein